MFSIKWGLIPGGAAFVLALISSLVFGGTSFSVALLRALIFAALFFGMGIGIRVLVKTFLSELLESDTQKNNAVNHVFSPTGPAAMPAASPAAGSQVNITLDDPGLDAALPAALPEQDDGISDDLDGGHADGFGGDVGNFADLVSPSVISAPTVSAHKDIDQNHINGYTEGIEEFSPALDDAKDDNSGGFALDFGTFVSGAEEMEDGGSFMDSFSPFSDEDAGLPEEIVPQERKPSGNKTEKLEGDFNAKEIAAGLRTVLEKDKNR